MAVRRDQQPVLQPLVPGRGPEIPVRPMDDLSPTDEWDLRRVALALSRRKSWVVGTIVLAVMGALVYLVAAPPMYEGRAKLLIEPQTPNVVTFKGVIEEDTAKLDYFETQLGMLKSRTLARRTLDTLQLWNRPDFVEREGRLKRAAAKVASVAPFVAVLLPVRDPQLPVAKNETAAQSYAIDAFLRGLSISYRADNRLFEVVFRSTDPRMSADAANTLAQNYIDYTLDLKSGAAKKAYEWLNVRLDEQRKQVEASEQALQKYREQNYDAPMPEQQDIYHQKLVELNTAVIRARNERIESEALYQQLQEMRTHPGTGGALPMLVADPTLQQLKTDLANLQREESSQVQRLGDKHPDLVKTRSEIARVQQQLRDGIGAQADSIRSRILASQTTERGLQAAISAQQGAGRALTRRSIQYSALERDVNSNRQLYDTLLERAKQTEIAAELKTTNVQIVDPAETPRLPVYPRPALVLLLAFVIALPVGVGAALGADYLDDRIASPDEVRNALGFRFLGVTPAIRRPLPKASMSLVDQRLPPAFAEALRTLRANVFISAANDGTKTLLVTSTGPGEGKTVVATNLAIGLAQTGRRVLLIDADMRRSQVHRIFGQSLDPGLSDILEGKARIQDAVRPSKIGGLTVLTAGRTPRVPGDLLERPIFGDAVRSVEDEYDWIVIDSPPVMVASDATLLAQVADAVLFVVGAQMTSGRDARAALDQLDATSAKIIGVVLSRADIDRYAPYYRAYESYRPTA